MNVDPFLFQVSSQRDRDFRLLMGKCPLTMSEDGNLGSKAGKQQSELQSQRSRHENKQTLRKFCEGEDLAIRQIANLVDSGKLRNAWGCACSDEEALPSDSLSLNLHL